MPILNSAAQMKEEVTGWRRHLHENPELLYDVVQTAAFVEEKLKAFGCDEVVAGLGRTGIVGLIKGSQGEGPTIGLRADMDALPIHEQSGKEWKSKIDGKMHACGHDGHTAMLLGAAKHLCEQRNFAGTIAVIFQPAEEGGAGGAAMVKDGLMEKFSIREVYGLHNMPGLPLGHFATRNGGIMAGTREFDITIVGHGGHAAKPNETIDPIVIGAQIIANIQQIASRNVDPVKCVVVSVTQFHAGTAHNVIPGEAKFGGTIRALEDAVGDYAEQRLTEIAEGVAAAHGAKAQVKFRQGYPVTSNHAEQTALTVDVAREVAGTDAVSANTDPVMGGEDFSFMLNERPGSYIMMGVGKGPGLHHPEYDFNDEAIPYGVSYWVRLAQTALAA